MLGSCKFRKEEDKRVQQISTNHKVGFALNSAYSSEKVKKWNSNGGTPPYTIFWAPATKKNDRAYNIDVHGEIETYTASQVGDEVSSILGRPPTFNCSEGTKFVVERNGRK